MADSSDASKNALDRVSLEESEGVLFRHLKAGEFLLRQGERSKNIFVVKKGKLKVFKTTNKKEVVLATIKERQMVGEMAFVDSSPRSASVQALEPSIVVELDADVFDRYLKKQPFWFRVMVHNLLARVRKLNDRIDN